MGLTETVCATVEDPKIGGAMGHVGGRVPGAPKGASGVAAVPQPTGVVGGEGPGHKPRVSPRAAGRATDRLAWTQDGHGSDTTVSRGQKIGWGCALLFRRAGQGGRP